MTGFMARALQSLRLLTGLMALALVPALTGCAVGPSGRPPLRLAITDWPGYEYFYLAQEWDLASPQGINLQVYQYSSLQDQRFSYQQGEVDAIATTVAEALAICQEMPPRCPQLVLVLDESMGGDQLIAHRRVASLAALRGQSVGLERGVLGDYVLLRALDTVGLGLDDVQLVYAGPRALVDRLLQNDLAAVVTYPPYSADLMGDGSHHTLFSSRQLPRDVVDVLAVSPDLARRHPQQVGALVATWWAAREQASRQPAAALALMARREGISEEAFRRSESLLRYVEAEQQRDWLRSGGWLEATVTRIAQSLQASGHLDRTMPLPQVNPRWVNAARRP